MTHMGEHGEVALLAGDHLDRRIAGLADAGPRRAALALVRALGLPGRRSEAWKFTPLGALAAAPLRLADPPPPALASGAQVLLVNGFIQPGGALPAGITLTRQPLLTEPPPADQPLAALNAALFVAAVELHVDGACEKLDLVSLGQGDVHFHPRLQVGIAAGASATLVERHRGEGAYFSNGLTRITLGPGATLRHYVVQEDGPAAFHLSAATVTLDAGAAYQGFVLQLGGRLGRHEVVASLDGEGADFSLGGVIIGGGAQHLDDTIRIIHRAPGGRSRLAVKTVLDDHAHGVFQGKVRVEPAAQRTDAHQLSRALPLSATAAMDGKPELEIFADDVKCGHGAAIGSLDEEALFYLRSRGIEAAAARHLLIEGFVAEAIETITDATVREALRALVGERLRQGVGP